MNKLVKNKKFQVIILVFFVCLVTIFIGRSFAILTPVRSIVITSKNSDYSKRDAGSWQVTKSAKWTSTGKARITFDLDTVMKTANDYVDVILALDISGSMEGDKLARLKRDAYNLLEKLFENGSNRASIITFESTSEIVERLSNDKDKLIEDINNLQVAGGTNYYQALKNVDRVLEGYSKEDKRDVILLFLTDGYPTENTPSEVGEYNYLKSQYPFLIINGVQYEMGSTVLEPIKKVSDNQFIADVNSLNNVLVEASTNSEKYDSFEITDYIDERYFSVADIKSINASVGDATIEMEGSTPKVIWNIGKGSLRSGQSAKLTIDLLLNDEYLDKGALYPVNRRINVISSMKDIASEDVVTEKMPVLADNYVVKYDVNAPSDCEVSNVLENENHSVFQTVHISDQKLVCGNYQFKGWEIINKDVTRVNNDYFIMPEEDVVIRAKWGALSLSKSMDGEISKVQTLYNVLKDAAVLDNVKSEFVNSSTGIDFSKVSSDTNGKGVYERSSTKDDSFPVYYYRGDVKNNNLKFGGFCWKMVRTTSTGGVKVIYNGVPDSEGRCKNTTEASTQIGNSFFSSDKNSPAYNGYMYGDVYAVNGYNMPTWDVLLGIDTLSEAMINTRMVLDSTGSYYADSVRWDGENYILENSDGSEVVSTIWEGNFSSLKGKYRCENGYYKSCSSAYYIADTDKSYIHYLTLTEGKSLNDVNKEWNFSKTVRYENGRYVLVDPVVKVINAEWNSKYSDVDGDYYSCFDGSTSCEVVRYNKSVSKNELNFVEMSGGATYDSLYEEAKNIRWIYGNDVEWDGANYKISEASRMESSPLDWSKDRASIGKGYHYTCFSTTDICKDVYYVAYSGNIKYPCAVTLSGGEKVEGLLTKIQKNVNDSTVKKVIDSWYFNNMIDYNSYLEDTIWCNDRSIYDYAGWLKDGDSNTPLKYNSYFVDNGPNLNCPSKNDSFTVSEENGNGALTYPIALLTSTELTLAGARFGTPYDNHYLYNNRNWWTLSTHNFDGTTFNISMYQNGYPINYNVLVTSGVRPSISIRAGIRTSGGDGSLDDPYTLELD